MLAKGRRKRKGITGLYVTLVLAVAMLIGGAQTAFGAEAVTYLDSKGVEKTVTDYTEVTSQTTTLNNGWYVLKNDAATNTRIDVSGNDVNLILEDGATLTAENGIHVGANKNLAVYSQSIGDNMGTIKAYVLDSSFKDGVWTRVNQWTCIGANGTNVGGTVEHEDAGNLTINGGQILAGWWYAPENLRNQAKGNEGQSGAAIGGTSQTDGGQITINNGKVGAVGVDQQAAIGAGSSGGVSITINGGEVEAEAGMFGCGIGGARYANTNSATVTINGGKVSAWTTHAYNNSTNAAIGAGEGTVTINGGEIYAQAAGKTGITGKEWSGYQPTPAAGIGGGCNVIINGGNIVANGDAGGGIGKNNGSGQVNLNLKRIKAENRNDSVKATAYTGTVRSATKLKYDNGGTWESVSSGLLNDDAKAAIAGREVFFMGKDPGITVGVVGDDNRAKRARKELAFEDKEGNPEPHLTLVQGEENAIQLDVKKDSDGDITLTSGAGTRRFEFDKNWKIWGGNIGTLGYYYNGMWFKTEETDEYEAGEYRIGYRVPNQEPVKYLDAKGKERVCTEHYPIGSGSVDTFYDGFYVTDMTKKTLSNRVDIMGDTHIILRDGYAVTSKSTNGDTTTGLHVPENSSLTFYSQSLGENMGKYTVNIESGSDAGIGSDDADPAEMKPGDITINGGEITAINSTTNGNPAAIGSAMKKPAGNITINNGTVVAESGMGAGIGSGNDGKAGMIVINGGNVTGTAKSYGAGIGGGRDQHGGTIIINGGTVKGYGAHVGGGSASGFGGAGIGGEGADITINGGDVYGESARNFYSNLNRVYSSGIGGGGGSVGNACNVTINGGKVEGKGYTAGIGPAGDGTNSSVKLAWKEQTDYIKNTKGITGSVSAVKSFKYKNDNGETVTLRKGQLSSETLSAILNREITPNGTAQTVKIKDSSGNDITGETVRKTTDTQSFDITAEVTPEGGGPVTYESEDPSVATVYNDGSVLIRKSGITYITARVASTDDLYSAYASFRLVVNKSDQTLTFTNIVGNAVTKYATDAPFNVGVMNNRMTDGGAITWSSSDPSVAEVDADTGIVTLKKYGTVNITATAAATDRYNQATASYRLTVNRTPRKLVFKSAKMRNATEASPYDIQTDSTLAPTVYVRDHNDKDVTGKENLDYTTDSADWIDIKVVVLDGGRVGQCTPKKGNDPDDPDPVKNRIIVSVPADDQYDAAETTLWVQITKVDPSFMVYEGNQVVALIGNPFTNPRIHYTTDEPFIWEVKDKTGDGELSYSSSDTEIATIDDTGKITLTGKSGDVTITITAGATDKYAQATAARQIEVRKTNQPLTFDDEDAQNRGTVYMTCGDAPRTITAINGREDGGEITYRIEGVGVDPDPEVLSVDENTGELTVGKAPTEGVYFRVVAVAAETEKYISSSEWYYVFVRKAWQNLTFNGGVENGQLTKTYGDADFQTDVTTNQPELAELGGFPVNYESSNEEVATIDSNGTVSLRGAGTTQISARAQTTDYLFAKTVTYELTVNKGAQELTLVNENNEIIEDGSTVEKTVGDKPFTVEGKLNVQDGGTVSYGCSDDSVAMISPNGKIVILDEGQAYITASASENHNYEASNEVGFWLKVEKATPTELQDPNLRFESIEGGELIKKVNSADFTTEAISDGDGEISYRSEDENVAMITYSGKVTIKGVGQTYITAVVSATDKYRGAKATYLLTVEDVQQDEQTIVFEGVDGNRLIKKYSDGSFSTPATTTPEGAVVSYRSENENVAMITQDGEVLIRGVGEAKICATAAAYDEYAEAVTEYTLVVEKGDQQVAFNDINGDSLEKKTTDEAYNSEASTTGDGAITYESGNENVAVISNTGKVTIMGAGVATITATAAETDLYAGASASYLLNVDKANQTVTFKNIKGSELQKTTEDKTVSSAATTTGDGKLTYSSSNTKVATVDSHGTVTIRGAGKATITVKAAETDRYHGASASYVLNVKDIYKQMGTDGTPVGPGASEKAANKTITKTTSDKDIKGSRFAPLKVKSTSQGKTNIKLTWAKNKKATRYVVYGNLCNVKGKKYKPIKLATVKGGSYNVKKINKTKVRKGTYYKFVVVALDKKNNVVSTSKMIHVATRGGKVGNHKSVTVKVKSGKKYKAVSKVSVKKGKTVALKVTQNPVSKKLKVVKHVGPRYETSNAKIATVSGGKIKGKSKGTCYVYVYAQNGVSKAIKVTVK